MGFENFIPKCGAKSPSFEMKYKMTDRNTHIYNNVGTYPRPPESFVTFPPRYNIKPTLILHLYFKFAYPLAKKSPVW